MNFIQVHSRLQKQFVSKTGWILRLRLLRFGIWAFEKFEKKKKDKLIFDFFVLIFHINEVSKLIYFFMLIFYVNKWGIP